MATENREVVQYTWEDIEALKTYMLTDMEPRDLFDTPNKRLHDWLEVEYGKRVELYRQIADFLFHVPLEDVPLYINTSIPYEESTYTLSVAAKWRLSCGR